MPANGLKCLSLGKSDTFVSKKLSFKFDSGYSYNHIMAKSRHKNKPENQSTRKKILTWALRVGGAGTGLVIVFILLVYLGLFGRLPSEYAIKNIRNQTASIVYSADGVMIGKYFLQNRLTIDNANISQNVKNALIATEDSRFFDHKGLDYKSLGRVFFRTILLRDRSQGGGSTISQQLAKNLYPRRSRGLLTFPANKVREIFIAARIERVFHKEEILGLYLNTVPFGEDVYGIEVAAHRFFGKSSTTLTVPEAATLVGMLAANTAYNPRINPERSLIRRNVVIDRMHANGFISAEDADRFKKTAIDSAYTRLDYNHGPAPYFMEQVRIRVEAILKAEYGSTYNIYTDGLRIHTTLDATLQRFASAAIKSHMSYLQKLFEEHWGTRDPWHAQPEIYLAAMRRTPRYQRLKERGKSEQEIFEAFDIPVSTTIFSHYGGEQRVTISPADSLKKALRTLHTGFLALNPSNGHVLAWEGGVNFQYFKYDHVTTKRQVGSTFKPIVYATALNKGFDPCEFISNERRIYTNYNDWSPTNSDNNHQGYYSLKGGLIHSANTIAAEVILKTGITDVISMSRRMGITSAIPQVPSIALGTADISLLEMITAYSAFANYGRAVEPVMLLKIEDASGNVLYEADPAGYMEEAFNEETARMMVEILREAIARGTGQSLYGNYNLQGDYAGKTGTTQNNSDGWFIGFTPNIVAGAWVGGENPGIHFRSTSLGQGAHMALPIFARFMQQAERSPYHTHIRTQRFFPLPDHLIAMLDCDDYSDEIIIEDTRNFFERLFQRQPKVETRQPEKTDLEEKEERDRNLLNRMKDLFKKKEETN
jgi:penicillin-binding protein 1A